MGLPESTVAMRLSKYLNRWNDDNGEPGFWPARTAPSSCSERWSAHPISPSPTWDRTPNRRVPNEPVPDRARPRGGGAERGQHARGDGTQAEGVLPVGRATRVVHRPAEAHGAGLHLARRRDRVGRIRYARRWRRTARLLCRSLAVVRSTRARRRSPPSRRRLPAARSPRSENDHIDPPPCDAPAFDSTLTENPPLDDKRGGRLPARAGAAGVGLRASRLVIVVALRVRLGRSCWAVPLYESNSANRRDAVRYLRVAVVRVEQHRGKPRGGRAGVVVVVIVSHEQHVRRGATGGAGDFTEEARAPASARPPRR